MNKFIIITLILLSIGLFSAFTFKKEKVISKYIAQPEAVYTVSPDPFYYEKIDIPGVGNAFIGFKEALGFKESQGKYYKVNTLGYLGKYQFGKSTLETLRIYNTDYFLNTPSLQEKAFIANCNYNYWLLKDLIEKYSGKKIKGVRITESGIIAAAHLAGAGSVKKFLRNNYGRKISDAYGTNIKDYFKEFANYDVSFLEATPKPIL